MPVLRELAGRMAALRRSRGGPTPGQGCRVNRQAGSGWKPARQHYGQTRKIQGRGRVGMSLYFRAKPSRVASVEVSDVTIPQGTRMKTLLSLLALGTPLLLQAQNFTVSLD